MSFTVTIHGHAILVSGHLRKQTSTENELDLIDGIEGTDEVGCRRVSGTQFKGKANKSIWFQIPCPISQQIRYPARSLSALEVLFNTTGQASVQSICLADYCNSTWYKENSLDLQQGYVRKFLPVMPLERAFDVYVEVHFQSSADILFEGVRITLE